jgi:hypothetical protein
LKPWQQHISCVLPTKAISLNQPQLVFKFITSVGWVTGWNQPWYIDRCGPGIKELIKMVWSSAIPALYQPSRE